MFDDHGNLRWLMSQRQTGRLAKWQLDLQQYDFTIAYVKGVNNLVADCLSRDIDAQIHLMAMTRLQARKKQESKNAHGHPERLKNTIHLLPLQNRDKPNVHELKSLYHSVDWQMKQSKDKALKDCFKDKKNGGIEKTSYHMSSVWFSGMRKRIRDHCHSFYTCLLSKGLDNWRKHFTHSKASQYFKQSVFGCDGTDAK